MQVRYSSYDVFMQIVTNSLIFHGNFFIGPPNHPTNSQPVNHPANLSASKRAASQPASQSACQPANQPATSQPALQSINQPASQTVSQPPCTINDIITVNHKTGIIKCKAISVHVPARSVLCRPLGATDDSCDFDTTWEQVEIAGKYCAKNVSEKTIRV